MHVHGIDWTVGFNGSACHGRRLAMRWLRPQRVLACAMWLLSLSYSCLAHM